MKKQDAVNLLGAFLKKEGGVTPAFKEGFVAGYIQAAVPSGKTLEKVASATGVPERAIKEMMLKKAMGPLGVLLGGLALTQAPKVINRALGSKQPGLKGPGLETMGGLDPKSESEFQRHLARMRLTNLQSQLMMQSLRSAMNPMGGTPFAGV